MPVANPSLPSAPAAARPASPASVCWWLLLLLLLQSTFVFKGFDEVRRLGLRQETEAVVRLAKARSHGAPGEQVVALSRKSYALRTGVPARGYAPLCV
jgi:hypothetical protein